MVEREFADEPISARMTQAESGLISEEVWWDMVAALTKEREYDRRPDRLKPYSRGRHHRPHEVADDYEVTYCPNDGLREHQIRLDGAVLRCIEVEEEQSAER